MAKDRLTVKITLEDAAGKEIDLSEAPPGLLSQDDVDWDYVIHRGSGDEPDMTFTFTVASTQPGTFPVTLPPILCDIYGVEFCAN